MHEIAKDWSKVAHELGINQATTSLEKLRQDYQLDKPSVHDILNVLLLKLKQKEGSSATLVQLAKHLKSIKWNAAPGNFLL